MKLTYPGLKGHRMNLDDVVSAQIETLETFEVPENGLGHRGQRVAGQVKFSQRAAQWTQFGTTNLRNEVI